MTRPILCLLAFAGWAILLAVCIAFSRVSQVLTGKKRANEFPSGVPHGSDAYWRLNRAHINTLENLPLFAAVVLSGTWLHVATPLFSTLATVAIGARVVQSLAHVSSGSSMAVNVRFTAFATQLACFVAMGVQIVLVAR